MLSLIHPVCLLIILPSCIRKCEAWTSRICLAWELMRNAASWGHPKPIESDSVFFRTPKRFICTLTFEEYLCTPLCKRFLLSQVMRIKLPLDKQEKGGIGISYCRTGIFGGREKTLSWEPYFPCFWFCIGSKCQWEPVCSSCSFLNIWVNCLKSRVSELGKRTTIITWIKIISFSSLTFKRCKIPI